MINLEKAKKEFEKYINKYSKDDPKISLKINHTYGVINASEYIAKELKLSKEDLELAKLIALLHDIGRFEQAKSFNNFEDYKTVDHAELGIDILFNKKLIRNFITENKYDDIIYKAILNHNKYEIEEGLSNQELLHSKIIRDADKLDNFRVKQFESIEVLCNVKEKDMGKENITEKIYNDFMNCKTIVVSERKTPMDHWVSYIAFVFDLNFIASYKYVKEKDYIQKLVNRIEYTNIDTKMKMEKIKKCAMDYIDTKINNK